MVKQFKGKTIIVTGGCGFIGSCLIDMLKAVDCRIKRYDMPEAAWLPVNDTIAQIEDCPENITDQGIAESLVAGADIIFHLAAQTSAYKANDDPAADYAVNVAPLVRMLETCRTTAADPIIIFSSTVTQFGLVDRLPVDETFSSQPMSVYALHKYIAEEYLKYYIREGVVRGAILRLANVYGPGPKSSRADRGILNKMVRMAFAGEDLTVYGAGEYVRDYVMVCDVARAFCAAANAIKAVNGGHFIIGTGVGTTLKEAFTLVADKVATQTGRRVAIKHLPWPEGMLEIEKRNFIADSSLFMTATGWQAAYTLSEGIDLIMEACRS